MDFKKEQQKIISEIEKSKDEIEFLKKELIQIIHDKEFYKRKEDTPAFDRTLEKEINFKDRINSLSNEIKILENNLSKSKDQEKVSHETREQMKKVLKQLRLGKNRVQASRNAVIPLSKVNKWYNDGKQGSDLDSIWFYERASLYETFHHDFFNFIKKDFKKKGKIHLLSYFVPDSYPQRMDKYVNDKLWFSRLELRGSKSIYYFGIKGDNIPRLILTFHDDINKSNFRLHEDELLLLLRFNDINQLKKDFKVFCPKNNQSDLFYISLGKLNSGKLSKSIELLITNYRGDFFNPLTVIK